MRNRAFLLAAVLAPALGFAGVLIFQTEPAGAYHDVAVPAVAQTRIVVGRGMFGVNLGATMKQVRHTLGGPTRSQHRRGGPLWSYSRLRVEVGFNHGVVSYLSTRSPKPRTAKGVGVGSSERTVKRLVPGVVCPTSRGHRTADCVVNLTIAGFRSRTEFLLGSDPAVESVVMTGAAVASPVCVQSTGTATCTYLLTATQQEFTVPTGVRSLQVGVIGGHGGSSNSAVNPGGRGAKVSGALAVTPGSVLYLEVGGNGPSGNGETNGQPGGFNGGGAAGKGVGGATGGSGGAGASDIRTKSTTASGSLNSRIVVAAGGGGAPGYTQPGSHGGDAGQPGTSHYQSSAGGGAGTATAGGAGSSAKLSGCSSSSPPSSGCGSAGTQGSGGQAGDGVLVPHQPCQEATCTGGGGGGGGLYGGGGGSAGGGGGGGSSLVPAGFSLDLDSTATPEITVSWPAPAVTITTPADGATYTFGQIVLSSFSCTDIPGGPGISSCKESQQGFPSGSPIITDVPGPHKFTVTATDKNGVTGSATVTYTVAGG